MSNEDFARSPATPPEALAMLSTSPSAEVRRLVALNPNTPVAALRFLAADEDRAVREAVATNPLTPYDAFAAREAPPAPVQQPMSSDASLDSSGGRPEPAPLQEHGSVPAEAVPPEAVSAEPFRAEALSAEAAAPDTVPAAFVPASPEQQPLSLWRRLLAFLGFQ